jgi:DMSO/TMAO reductase YedYZ molybdopterin-dependent catalytic subunit
VARLVPPGRYQTDGFPVSPAAPAPRTPLPEWTFSVRRGGSTLKSWTWQDIQDLPAGAETVDIHCVTRWSKLSTRWRGVSVGTLLDQVEHDEQYVIAFCDEGYRASLPIEDITGGKAWLAFCREGGVLDAEHGGPPRLDTPRLYFRKTAKWVRGLELMDHDAWDARRPAATA